MENEEYFEESRSTKNYNFFPKIISSHPGRTVFLFKAFTQSRQINLTSFSSCDTYTIATFTISSAVKRFQHNDVRRVHAQTADPAVSRRITKICDTRLWTFALHVHGPATSRGKVEVRLGEKIFKIL